MEEKISCPDRGEIGCKWIGVASDLRLIRITDCRMDLCCPKCDNSVLICYPERFENEIEYFLKLT